jgi:hypothetical protein
MLCAKFQDWRGQRESDIDCPTAKHAVVILRVLFMTIKKYRQGINISTGSANSDMYLSF